MSTTPIGTPSPYQPQMSQQLSRPTSPTKRRLGELSLRLSAIKQGLSDERTSRLDTLERRIQDLNQSVTEVQRSTSQKCHELNDRIAAQEQSLEESQKLRQEITDQTSGRFQDLSDRVDALVKEAEAVSILLLFYTQLAYSLAYNIF